ncbi:uncharacterized protein [Centruroides vittatus]|uniref:uncharacterized protein n=1 Tax=Centruroides vittatus TaxID=120091 RepID=UPI00350F5CD1
MEAKRPSLDSLDDIILEPFLNDGYAELHDDLQENVFDYQEETLDEHKTHCSNNGKVNNDVNELIENKGDEKEKLINNNHVDNVKHEEIVSEKHYLRKRKADFEMVNHCKNRKIQKNSLRKEYFNKNGVYESKRDVNINNLNCKNYIFISLKISALLCLLIVFIYYIYIYYLF